MRIINYLLTQLLCYEKYYRTFALLEICLRWVGHCSYLAIEVTRREEYSFNKRESLLCLGCLQFDLFAFFYIQKKKKKKICFLLTYFLLDIF
jgi:hypothetical protein